MRAFEELERCSPWLSFVPRPRNEIGLVLENILFPRGSSACTKPIPSCIDTLFLGVVFSCEVPLHIRSPPLASFYIVITTLQEHGLQDEVARRLRPALRCIEGK